MISKVYPDIYRLLQIFSNEQKIHLYRKGPSDMKIADFMGDIDK